MRYCLDYERNSFLELCAEAMSFNSSAERLSVLASEENIFIRYWVARNPNTPVKILEQLATEEYYRVRCGVVENLNCPHYLKKAIKFKKLLRKL
jgi:hypothetical protein